MALERREQTVESLPMALERREQAVESLPMARAQE
jgi:hypothetical protein